MCGFLTVEQGHIVLEVLLCFSFRNVCIQSAHSRLILDQVGEDQGSNYKEPTTLAVADGLNHRLGTTQFQKIATVH